MKVLIPTCDAYIKYIEALQYTVNNECLFSKHDFIILGYKHPEFELADNFTFVCLGKDRGANFWSNDVRSYIVNMEDSHFIYGNDDCAITFFNSLLLSQAIKLCKSNDSIGRFALMGEGKDRPIVDFHIIEPDGARVSQFTSDAIYRLSLGWSIWNKECFLESCKDGLNPWQFELSSCDKSTSSRLDKWAFCTFLPSEVIDAAYFRRKNIRGVNDGWDLGYYGHNLHGEAKEIVKEIIFR